MQFRHSRHRTPRAHEQPAMADPTSGDRPVRRCRFHRGPRRSRRWPARCPSAPECSRRASRQAGCPARSISLMQRAGARGELFALIPQHDDIAEGRFRFDGAEVQQRGRVDAAAPRRAQDFLERDAFRFQARADLFRIRPPPGAEVALRGAVVDTKSRRIAETARRIGVTHQGDVAARAQRLPGIGGIVSAGDF